MCAVILPLSCYCPLQDTVTSAPTHHTNDKSTLQMKLINTFYAYKNTMDCVSSFFWIYVSLHIPNEWWLLDRFISMHLYVCGCHVHLLETSSLKTVEVRSQVLPWWRELCLYSLHNTANTTTNTQNVFQYTKTYQFKIFGS